MDLKTCFGGMQHLKHFCPLRNAGVRTSSQSWKTCIFKFHKGLERLVSYSVPLLTHWHVRNRGFMHKVVGERCRINHMILTILRHQKDINCYGCRNVSLWSTCTFEKKLPHLIHTKYRKNLKNSHLCQCIGPDQVSPMRDLSLVPFCFETILHQVVSEWI